MAKIRRQTQVTRDENSQVQDLRFERKSSTALDSRSDRKPVEVKGTKPTFDDFIFCNSTKMDTRCEKSAAIKFESV
jgi:hypothetical protein